MRAASIDRDKALSIFSDGKPHTSHEVAVALGVHTRTAAWFMVQAARRGWLRRVPQRERVAFPDFGYFERVLQ